LVMGGSGQCHRLPGDFDPMPMQKKLQEAGGTFVDTQTGGSITDKSEKPGIIERVISNGTITRGEVFVRGADECQETAASMRDTHMMPFQQRATHKPP
jgi:MOSC domain-containing protein YiiM